MGGLIFMFKVGNYYVSENKQIYKLIETPTSKRPGLWKRKILIDKYVLQAFVDTEELSFDREATEAEVALFDYIEKIDNERHASIDKN